MIGRGSRFLALLLLIGGLLQAIPPLQGAGCAMPCCKRGARGACCPRQAGLAKKGAEQGCRLSSCAPRSVESALLLWRDGQPAVLRTAAPQAPEKPAMPVPMLPSLPPLAWDSSPPSPPPELRG